MPTVTDAYAEMLAAIDAAVASIRFEFYVFRAGGPGERFRAALTAAARRGVRVRILLDAFGSGDLPDGYWDPLIRAEGEAAKFNPASPLWFSIRSHRKLVLIDDCIAFLGGFNIGPEYEGDGVARGWRDLGLAVRGPAVAHLAASFDLMWEHRRFRRFRLLRSRRARWKRLRDCSSAEVMAIGPGMGRNMFRKTLVGSLGTARDVRIIASYFVPGLRLRRALMRVARRGGRVRLLLAGKSDIAFLQAAGRSFYRRLLSAGVEIAEYEPQILHAKLAIVDRVVYAGSSNLDARSFSLNYEIMMRIVDAGLSRDGCALFDADWARSRPIRRAEWIRTRTWVDQLYGTIARFALTKLDPWITRRQLRNLS